MIMDAGSSGPFPVSLNPLDSPHDPTETTTILGALILRLGAAFHLSALPQVRDALAGRVVYI